MLILSLFVGQLVLCLGAIVLGILTIRKSRGRPAVSAMGIAALVLGCGGVLLAPIVVGLGLPLMQARREADRRQQVQQNLREIGEGLRRYQENHPELLPPVQRPPDDEAVEKTSPQE